MFVYGMMRAVYEVQFVIRNALKVQYVIVYIEVFQWHFQVW